MPTPSQNDNGLAGWVDETSIKIKKEWMYLYRAVDSQGNTLDFWLSATRDAKAAQHFLLKMLVASHTSEPRVMTVDKNAAYRHPPLQNSKPKDTSVVPVNCGK